MAYDMAPPEGGMHLRNVYVNLLNLLVFEFPLCWAKMEKLEFPVGKNKAALNLGANFKKG